MGEVALEGCHSGVIIKCFVAQNLKLRQHSGILQVDFVANDDVDELIVDISVSYRLLFFQ